MDIDQLIKEIEDKHLDKALKELTPKDLFVTYLNIKEFQRAKLQRITAAPVGDIDTVFTIQLIEHDNTGNKSI